MDPRTKKILYIVGAAIIVAVVFFVARKAEAPAEVTNANSAAVINTLPAVDPESVGKIVKDPATGKEFMSNQLIIEFVPTLSEADSLALIAEHGAKMVARFTEAPVFLIQVKDPGDGSQARKLLDVLKGDPNIKSIELNFLTTLDEKPAQ